MNFSTRNLISVLSMFCFFIIQTAAQAETDAGAQSMQFRFFTPCLGSGSHCGRHILAAGRIDSDAVARLRSLAPQAGTTIYLHSGGGELQSALALGREFRRLRLNTSVGGAYTEEISSTVERSLIAESNCSSVAAFAFLGGLRREVVEFESLKFPTIEKLRGEWKSNSAESERSLEEELEKYLSEMEINPELMKLLRSAESSDEVVLSERQLVELEVYNSSLTTGMSTALSRHQEQKLEWQVDSASPVLRIVLEQENLHRTANYTVSIERNGSGLLLQFRVNFAAPVSAASLDESYAKLDTPDAMTGCTRAVDVALSAYECSERVFRKQIIPRPWTLRSPSVWEFEVQLNEVESAAFIDARPTLLQFNCELPNYLLQYDFCEAIPLTESFWQLMKLMGEFTLVS